MPASTPSKNRISARAVLAEIEIIEPKLKRHRQEFAPTFSASISGVFPAIFSQLGIKSPPSPQISQSLAAQTVSLSLENIGKVQSTPQLQQLVADAAAQSIINQKEIARGKAAAQIYEKIQEPIAQVVTENQKGLQEEAVLANIAQIAKKPDQKTTAIIRDDVESAVESEDPLMSPQELDQLISSVETHLEKSRENLNTQLANITLENLPSLEEFQEIKQKAHDETITQLQDQPQTGVNLKQLTSDISAELGIKPLDPDQADRFGLGFAQPTINTFRTDGLEGRSMAIKLATNEKAQEEAVLSILLHDKEKVEDAQHHEGHSQFFYERLNNFSSKNPQKAERYLNHFQKLKGGLNQASRTSWRTVYTYSNHYPGIFVPQSVLNQQVLVSANVGALSRQYGNFSVGNVVSGARGLGSGLKSAIGFGQGAKGAVMAGKLALGASNPAGWAMLAAQLLPFLKKHATKIIAGAIGLGILLLLMLLKLLTKLAAIAAGAATGAAIGAVLGFGLPGAIIGAIVGAGIGWIVSNWAVPVSNFVGGVFSGLGSAASTVGLAINSLGSAALSGVGSFFSGSLGFLGGASNIVLSVGSISVPAAVIFLPVAIGTGAVALLTTLIGIFTGTAFLATDLPTGPIVAGQNQYFSLTKIVTGSSHLENSALPTNITFQINLTAKVNLSNIQISDEVKVQAKNGNPSVTTDSNNKPLSPPCADKSPQSLSANQTWTCDLSITAQQNFADSFTINTVTVKAAPEGQKEITDFATATATIGNPPTICAIIDFQGPWTSDEKNNVLQACQAFDLSPKAVSLLQSAGKITIIRQSNGFYGNNVCGAVNGANVIGVACSLNTVPFAKYVINHEMGHIVGNFNGSTYQAFLNSGIFNQEGLIPTYPQNVSANPIVGPNESFAEMITEYMNSKTYSHPPRNWSPTFPPAKNYPGGPWNNPGSGYTTFQQDRPQHYNFTKNNIFGGTIY